MSLLNLRARPIVAFDETNAEHRAMYYQFLQRRTWGYCPYRFMAEGLNTNLVNHINGRMLEYYVNKEFKAKKPRTKSASNIVSKRHTVQTKARIIKKSVSA